MSKRADHTGERFGRLVVVGFDHRGKRRESYWRCVCDCGKEHVAGWGNLRIGYVRSCGCLHDEASRTSRLRHGMKNTRTYRIWSALKKRCLNPAAHNWNKYGGRGITVCERWRDDFLAFLADMGECPPERSIDRIDGRGHYEPGNCRWATVTEQSRNRSVTHHVSVDGTRLTLAECAAKFGVPLGTIKNRIARGIPTSVAATTRGQLFTAPRGRPPRVRGASSVEDVA